jgi:hypothetical protein
MMSPGIRIKKGRKIRWTFPLLGMIKWYDKEFNAKVALEALEPEFPDIYTNAGTSTPNAA